MLRLSLSQTAYLHDCCDIPSLLSDVANTDHPVEKQNQSEQHRCHYVMLPLQLQDLQVLRQ
jgi:hypothetical protein